MDGGQASIGVDDVNSDRLQHVESSASVSSEASSLQPSTKPEDIVTEAPVRDHRSDLLDAIRKGLATTTTTATATTATAAAAAANSVQQCSAGSYLVSHISYRNRSIPRSVYPPVLKIQMISNL